MVKLKSIICIALLATLWSACQREKDIEITIPYNGDKLVLYAFIGVDEQYAEVYKTQEVLETAVDFLVDVEQLNLYENQNQIISFSDNQNNFIAAQTLDTLSSFHVEVEANEGKVTSEPITFPEKIAIETYELEFNADSSKVLLNFSFDDKQGDHFYYFQIDKYYQGEIGGNDGEWFYENFSNTFSDENFAEQTFTFEEEIDLSLIKYENGIIVGLENSDAISITLYSLSESIYQFYRSTQQNSGSLGTIEESNLPIWTNVSNGHGVVGTYRKDFIFIDL